MAHKTILFVKKIFFLLYLWANFAFSQQILEIPKVQIPPVIDGKLDDPSWQKASVVNLFIPCKTIEPSQKTKVYCLCDEEKIYFAFECREQKINLIAATQISRDNAIFSDQDSISVFVQPDYKKDLYYQFSLNPLGTQRDLRFYGKILPGYHKILQNAIFWDGKWETKTYIGEDKWIAEIAIPFALFEITPETPNLWRIALERCEKPNRESSIWPTSASWDQPEEFGFIKLDVDFSKFWIDFDIISFGKSFIKENKDTQIIEIKEGFDKLKIKIKNNTGQNQNLNIYSIGFSMNKAYISLSPYEEKICFLPYEIRGNGKQTLQIEIREHNTIIFTKTIKIIVTPLITISPDLNYYTREKKVNLKIIKNFSSPEKLLGVLEIINRDNKKIYEQKILLKTKEEVIFTSFPIQNFPTGKYKILFTVYQNKKILLKKDEEIYKYPENPIEIKIDKWQNILNVSGKPIIPIGWVCGKDQLTFLQEGGFNLAFYYIHSGADTDYKEKFPTSKEDMPKLKSFLDTALENNIKVIVAIGSLLDMSGYNPSIYTTSFSFEYFKSCISIFANHPAILGWYIADEPELHRSLHEQKIKDAYEFIKNVDPYHPVFIVHCISPSIFNYEKYTDIIGVDPYPLPRTKKAINYFDSFNQISHSLDIAKLTDEKKPIMVVLQAFPWCYESDVPFRIPNEKEIKCMFYLSFIKGANIFLFFYSGDPKLPWYIFRDGKELWEGTKKIVKQINYLQEILILPNLETNIKVECPSDTIEFIIKRSKDAMYIISVNTKNYPIYAKFKNLLKCKLIEVLFENRKIVVNQNSFIDKFENFDVHIYKIVGE